MDVESGSVSSIDSCGSAGLAKTRTVISSMRRKMYHVRPLAGSLTCGRRGGHRLGAHHGYGRPAHCGPGGGRMHAAVPGGNRDRGNDRHGEGERDKAPMLYIGEKVGSSKNESGALNVDIAV